MLNSVSRLAQDLLTDEEQELAGRGRATLAVYRKNQDLISIGAYQAGSNPQIDRSIALHNSLNVFLRQNMGEGSSLEQSWKTLEEALSIGDPEQNESQPPDSGMADAMQQSGGAFSSHLRRSVKGHETI